MNVALVVPYSTATPEAGLIYLVARYLADAVPHVTQLTCNGVLPLCGRDIEDGWARNVSSCFTCSTDQRRLAEWAGAKRENLSRFVNSSEIVAIHRLLNESPAEELREMRYCGHELFTLVQGTFRARFCGGEFDARNPSHEQFLRRLYSGAARTLAGARGFLTESEPFTTLLAGGEDVITSSFFAQAEQSGNSTAVFRADLSRRATVVSNGTEALLCPLVVENPATMRTEVRTWPKELISVLNQLLEFLGIGADQLALPLAR